ncbi:MAG: NAD(P)H-dependent oxidoreductase [Candidatus Omnitrophica bacterium]|nr:NAD(P)H-dependent oxidoreductase [Candidatus Omnitrophota bacterium]
MKKIAVVYYSKSGNTKKMAEFIVEGAKRNPDVQVDLESVENFPLEKTLDYDGLIVGSPTYYGSMAYQIKLFFDNSVKFHRKLSGKVGAAFSSAANIGGGNETTINSILNAMLIHGMIIQGNCKGDHYGVVSIGQPDDRVKDQCGELGERTSFLVKRL